MTTSEGPGGVVLHHVAHGDGVPIIVLHGAGVDHREPEACFEPGLSARDWYRRLYPDLPGAGLTPAPASVAGADDVLDLLVRFTEEVAAPGELLLVGHSAGAHYAGALAARLGDRVAGLALVCPLLEGSDDVPEHRPVVAGPDLGDDGFRSYFVVQTPEMLERYERVVAPAAALADQAATARIGERWRFSDPVPAFEGPMLVVAGRQDATVGYATAVDRFSDHPDVTLAVVDGAGHALPHERPDLLAALLADWLDRSARRADGGQTG